MLSLLCREKIFDCEWTSYLCAFLFVGSVFFFFQAEDGIRDLTVTGVQTCALPILALRATVYLGLLGREGLREVAELCVQKTHHAARLAAAIPGYRLAHAGAFFREIGRASCRERV